MGVWLVVLLWKCQSRLLVVPFVWKRLVVSCRESFLLACVVPAVGATMLHLAWFWCGWWHHVLVLEWFVLFRLEPWCIVLHLGWLLVFQHLGMFGFANLRRLSWFCLCVCACKALGLVFLWLHSCCVSLLDHEDDLGGEVSPFFLRLLGRGGVTDELVEERQSVVEREGGVLAIVKAPCRIPVAFYLRVATVSLSPSGLVFGGSGYAGLLWGWPSDAERDGSICRVQIRRRHPSCRDLVATGSRAVPCVPALADGPFGSFQKGCRACLCLLGLSSLHASCAISLVVAMPVLFRPAPSCCFSNSFLVAVLGGTVRCSSRTLWRVRGPGWFCLWALNLVEEVQDVGACVVRLGSHVVAPGFHELFLSRRVCAEGYFRIVLLWPDPGVVFGLTRVLVEFCFRFVGVPTALVGRDSLSQEFVTGRSWWQFAASCVASSVRCERECSVA
ncbi:hypothetical protein Taro_021613 [Colocasia esculenta]|uniref:Uncharacterized protein n=1 Tax=Colocasia esculenta TaxID=4460 RepID=A0A843VC07_COLES|nr:hypothetical protein [Colocasia esculenta]